MINIHDILIQFLRQLYTKMKNNTQFKSKSLHKIIHKIAQVLRVVLDLNGLSEPLQLLRVRQHFISIVDSQSLIPIEEGLQLGVGSPLANMPFIFFLLEQLQLVVVEPSLLVIHVGELGDVNDPPVSHLQAGEENGYIVCCLQILAVLVLQILLLQLPQQLSIQCPQVAHHEGVLPVFIGLRDSLRDGLGVSQLALLREEVGVDYPSPSFLIDGVEELQDLPADELVVSVDNHEDLIGLAVLEGGPSYVHRAPLVLRVVGEDEVGDFALHLKVIEDLLAGVVGGGIVDDHDAVVVVVLHDYRFDIADVAVVGRVVVGGHDNAEGQLLVLADFVSLLVVGLLLV